MGVKKFEDEDLVRLSNQGLSPPQMAERLQVTPQAIHKRLNALQGDSALLATRQPISVIERENFDIMRELGAVHNMARGILDKIQGVMDGTVDPASLEPLLGGRSPADLLAKLLPEVRKQMAFCVTLQERVYNVERIRQLQNEVLSALGEVEPELREKIFNRLKEVVAVEG
jgi:hypothetical protein